MLYLCLCFSFSWFSRSHQWKRQFCCCWQIFIRLLIQIGFNLTKRDLFIPETKHDRSYLFNNYFVICWRCCCCRFHFSSIRLDRFRSQITSNISQKWYASWKTKCSTLFCFHLFLFVCIEIVRWNNRKSLQPISIYSISLHIHTRNTC